MLVTWENQGTHAWTLEIVGSLPTFYACSSMLWLEGSLTLAMGGVMVSMIGMLVIGIESGRMGCCDGGVATLVPTPTSVCASWWVGGCNKYFKNKLFFVEDM